MNPSVKSLHIYPLKSAQGISLPQLNVEIKGPQYDREWMLVDKNGTFVSQRTQPLLSQISTEISDQFLILKAKNMPDLKVDLSFYGDSPKEVKIFSEMTLAHYLMPIYDQWFSDFLKGEFYLVRSPKTENRQTSGRNGPKTFLKYADGYPFLLTNVATLNELNEKLDTPVTMTRFRPNIVIEKAPANKEDQWTKFSIGSVHFLSVKACSRCVIIEIDPKTGQKTNHVTKTLKNYRTKDGSVVFGMNLSHTNQGIIRVGQTLDDISY